MWRVVGNKLKKEMEIELLKLICLEYEYNSFYEYGTNVRDQS